MKKTVALVARTAAALTAAVLFTGAIVYPQGISSLKTAKPDANGGKPNTSIPMSTYSVVATKGRSKKPYTGTLAGTSPFASTLTGSTIPVVVVPVVVNINGTVFDPTAPNYCGSEGGVPAITRIMQSPIVEPGPLTFNGIDVGYVQYVDGFMRAQFWQTINGNPAYTNEFSFSVAPSVTINAGTSGITYQSGCQQLGISRTAPYMHDGSLMSLPQVIEYYDTGGAKNPSLDPKLRALHLSSMEKADLAAFLNSLTGRIQDGR